MADLMQVKCTNCGGNMTGAEKVSDVQFICPYCGARSFVSPPFSFSQKAIGDALSDPSKAIQKKGKSILYSFSFIPHLKGVENGAFEIEMHGFKMEYLDARGKELHQRYFDAVGRQDLEDCVSSLLALKNHRLKGCLADPELIKANRRGIVDSTRYFVKGFDASEEQKREVIHKYGLDRGLLKVGDSFVCPHCGGEIQIDSASKLTECPYCNNVFQQSGLDVLSRLT
ncbi:MAG: hypothetical protein JXR96_14995 [Deltaproteobacteria bacterium]|nr:hypothetical protein [Deltaproteobacteria bacterium]